MNKRDMMPVYFSEPAFSLEEGEHTKTPVKTPKGVYIIKVTDKVDLTEENIDKIIEAQKQRERIEAWLLRRYRSDYIARLLNADDVEFLYRKGGTYDNTDVCFRVGEKEYTVADIDKIIENRATQEELEKVYENGVMVNRAITFDDVRDEIYNELEEKAKFQRAQDWKEQMINEYSLKINETELEGT